MEKHQTFLRKKWRNTSLQPGVYLMRDRLGSIIYVGKAKNLRKRLGNYFMPSRKTKADLKTRALIDSIYDFDVQEVRNEAEALILETKLIKKYRPRYNILMRDDKRFYLVKVQMKDPYPQLVLTRLKKQDQARYFGPFVHSHALKETIEWLNKEFQLKTATPQVPQELNYEQQAEDNAESRAAYREKIEEVCSLLSGKGKREKLESVKKSMQTAADKLQFEKAAKLRDVYENLKKTLDPARQFTRHTTIASTINPEKDLKELGDYLNMEESPKVMECFDISNVSSTHIVASMVRFINGVPDNKSYRRYRIQSVKEQDDFASMAEVVQRRYRHIVEKNWQRVPEIEECEDNLLPTLRRLGKEGKIPILFPDLIIVDGGKGQLSAACGALRNLGLEQALIVGLAKQEEEIFFPNTTDPLKIPHETGALKLLQRIRDEAHRFANNYNELLLRRRMRESALDDCPGMTKSRKKALFAAFGTLAKMKQASEQDFLKIKGIGKKTATALIQWLH